MKLHSKAHEPAELSRRSFLRLSAAGTVLLSTFGSLGIVHAQGSREVWGRRPDEIRLTRTLADLERETIAQYRQSGRQEEFLPSQTSNGEYRHGIVVPGQCSFLVSLDPRTNYRSLGVRFAEGDRVRTVTSDLNDLATYVRTGTSQEIARIKYIIESGTYNGNPVTYAYIFPLDNNGDMMTRLGNGQYIVYRAAYTNHEVYADIYRLVEPNDRDTIARR